MDSIDTKTFYIILHLFFLERVTLGALRSILVIVFIGLLLYLLAVSIAIVGAEFERKKDTK